MFFNMTRGKSSSAEYAGEGQSTAPINHTAPRIHQLRMFIQISLLARDWA